MTKLLVDADHFVAGAALIGGISYFHTLHVYDLLATNERIMASSCNTAIKAFNDGRLQKVTYVSSSMHVVRQRRRPGQRPSNEESRPPLTSYGFQKLAVEIPRRLP